MKAPILFLNLINTDLKNPCCMTAIGSMHFNPDFIRFNRRELHDIQPLMISFHLFSAYLPAT